MGIFQSKYYPTLMFLLILSVLMITLFNIGDILEKSSKNIDKNGVKTLDKNSFILGLVTLKIDTNPSEDNSSNKVTSLRKYIFYDVIIGVLFLLSYILIKFIYKR